MGKKGIEKTLNVRTKNPFSRNEEFDRYVWSQFFILFFNYFIKPINVFVDLTIKGSSETKELKKQIATMQTKISGNINVMMALWMKITEGQALELEKNDPKFSEELKRKMKELLD